MPDQSSTDQLRDQFGEEATAAVEEIAATFAESGAGADSKVVFTHDRFDTIDNVAEGYDLLVVGETKPSLRDRLLGVVANRVIDDMPRPVLIVGH